MGVKKFLAGFALSLLLPMSGVADSSETVDDGYQITVYKSPACGCCRQWIRHLQDNGFTVLAVDSDDMTAVKKEYEVPEELRSCHTARINGYTIEGHVPAQDIIALLENGSDAAGLSVPGMPIGSPGMEMGARVDAYDVIRFEGEERTVVASYGEREEPAAELPVEATSSDD
ncbi:MAG: DUF411 domain-containing protein [Pseudomonadota bacterium]